MSEFTFLSFAREDSLQNSFGTVGGGWRKVLKSARSNAERLDFSSPQPKLGLSYKCAFESVTESICSNQGDYIQFLLLASEKHRALKNSLLSFDSQGGTEELRVSISELVNYLNIGFFKGVFGNFKKLEEYFSDRGKCPRICLKGGFELDERSTVFSVFRDNSVGYNSDDDLFRNTGFAHVFETGDCYLNNNIPKETLEGRYLNPRVCSDRLVNNCVSSSEASANWSSFWKNGSPDSHYKSTMIIPLTLTNNLLIDEFVETVNLQEVDKAIFGFLCFDSVEEFYFNKSIDSKVGYAFADQISIYLFTRMMYLDMSNSFRRASGMLKKSGSGIETKTLSQLRSSDFLLSNSREKYDLDVNLGESFSLKRSNVLKSIDENLVSFVRNSS